ncbi:uncharacterized protein LOC129577870 [Sitodiplosis mosellana]|uniref:uncharacterized protein LOC129577870 n=1 Tax=Sitodiplosis mosellana TaxID=263140 RepID=UPI00244465B1|nr:uncharacterized protein LOC129577870 [Sitodiplosis mosellana]XP_055321620.1 uncharacterized protein LOC129577870 [Sitodiplosis mosellana]
MTTIEERSEYLRNPFFTKPLYGDFSPFYKTIAVCSVLLAIIFIINIVLGCCSKHRQYWQDRHTGNRWIVSLWTATPHQNPPLDLTELEDVSSFYPKSADVEHPEVSYHRPQEEQRGYGRAYNQSQPAEEYVELQHQQKRESDI